MVEKDFEAKARAKCREYYYKNREKLKKQMREYGKKYYKKNRDKILSKQKERNKEYMKGYRKNNKNKIKKANQIQYLKNREKRLEYAKKWKKENHERINKHIKKRKKLDMDFLIRCRLAKQLRTILQNYTEKGKIMSSKKYGINWSEVVHGLEPFPKDISKYHIDHVIPVSWFDFNNLQEIKWCFDPCNLQWLTKEENLKKGNKYIMVAERMIKNG